MRIRDLGRQVLATVLSAALVLQPLAADAQKIVVDVGTMPNAPHPSLDTTQNGVPQVNIATPSAAGLSHNQFTQYNVGPSGLILNNATTMTKTQIGGYIYGNVNLNGTPAKIILNEVTGSSNTLLNGFTEVAGTQADVVVANPNGITCSGCGFINTPRVTLSTGTPNISNGALTGLTVNGGQIDFQGTGGNFTQVPVLDIVSRNVVLNAPVNGGNLIRVTTGRNSWDYASAVATPLPSDGSTPPAYAIDSSVLGGMYAGRISLIANEQGVGVRSQGTLAANAGDMTLSANGQLTLTGTTQASGAITVSGTGLTHTGTMQSGAATQIAVTGNLNNTGSITAPSSAVTISAGSLTNGGLMSSGYWGVMQVSGALQNSGTISAGNGDLSLVVGSLTNQTGGQIGTSAGVLYLQSTGNVTNNGSLLGSGGIGFVIAGTLDNSNGQIAASSGDIGPAPLLPTSSLGGLINTGGLIQAQGGNAAFTAGSYTDAGGGSISAAQTLSLLIAGAANIGPAGSQPSLAGTSGLTLTVEGTLTNAGSIGSSQGPVTVQAFSNVTNTGTLIAGTNIALSAASLANTGAQAEIVSSGGMTLSATGTLANTGGGRILAEGGNLTLSAGSLVNTVAGGAASNPAAGIGSSGTLLILTPGNITNSATLSGATGVGIGVNGTLDNTSGLIESAQGNVTIQADTATVSPAGAVINTGGTITAGQALSLQTNSYADAGGGTLSAGTGLDLTTSGPFTNNGSIALTSGDLTLTATAITNAPGASIKTPDGSLYLLTGSLTNGGKLAALNTFGASITGNLTNTGTIFGEGKVNLAVDGTLDNTSGTISSGLVNGQTGALTTPGSVTITGLTGPGAASVINTGGTIQATGGPASVTTGTYTDGGNGWLSGDTLLTLSATGAITTSGQLTGGTGVSVSAQGNVTNSGQIVAPNGTAIVATSGTLTNTSGARIAALSGDLGLAAQNLTNAGKLAAGGNLIAQVPGNLTNSGFIYAISSVGLGVDGTLDTSGGQIVAQNGAAVLGGDTNAAMTALVNNGGQINAAAGNLTIATGTYQGDGTSIVNAGQALTLTASGAATNSGQVSGNTLSLTAGSLTNSGSAAKIAAATSAAISVSGLLANGGGGIIAADGGNLTVTAGSLTNGSAVVNGQVAGGIAATGLLTVSSGGNVTNSGTLSGVTGVALNLDGTLDNTNGIITAGALDSSTGAVTVPGTITIGGLTGPATAGVVNTGGAIQALGGNIAITAGSYTDAGGGLAKAGTTLTLTSSGAVSSAGTLFGATGATLTGTTLTNSGTIDAKTGALTLTFSGAADNTGTLVAADPSAATGSLVLTASSLTNGGAASIEANGPVTLTIGGDTNNSGSVTSVGGNLTLTAATLENSGGIASGAALSVTVPGNVSNSGTMFGGTALTLATDGTLDNSGGTINSGSANSAGTVLTAGNVTIGGDSGAAIAALINTGGTIRAIGGPASVTTGAYTDNGGGTLYGGTTLLLSASGAVTSAGSIESQGNLTLTAASLTNGGAIANNAGTLTITSLGLVTNNAGAAIDALSGAITLNANALTNNGEIDATTAATVTLAGALTNGGRLTGSTGDLTVTAASLANSGTLSSGTNAILNIAGNVANPGEIYGNGNVTLNSDGALDTSNGSVIANNGTLTLQGLTGAALGYLTNNNGTVQSNNGAVVIDTAALAGNGGFNAGTNLTLTLPGDYAASANLTAAGTLTLNLGGALTLDSSQTLVAAGSLTVNAASVTNAGAIAATGGALTLTTTGDVTNNAGLLYATNGLTARIGGNLTNTNGAVLADGGDLIITTTGNILNHSGLIQATTGNVTLTAASVVNDVQGGVTVSASGATVYSVYYTTPSANVPAINPFTVQVSENQGYYNSGLHYIIHDPLGGSGEVVEFIGITAGSVALHVYGIGSTATRNGAAALISAGNNLNINAGSITNDASNITAVGNIAITGGTLNNVGYTTQTAYYTACPQAGSNAACRFQTFQDPSLATPSFESRPSYLFNPTPVLWFYGPSPGGATGSIIAGGNLTGTLSGAITNTNVITGASAGQMVTYGGAIQAVPGSNSAAAVGAGAALNGGSVTLPGVSYLPGGLISTAQGVTPGNVTGASGLTTGGTGFTPGAGGALGAVSGATSIGSPLTGGGPGGTSPAPLATATPSLTTSVPVSAVISGVSGGQALFIPNPNPGAGYLIESRYQFATPQGLEGSQYLLDRLGLNPQSEPPLLGDAYFEQKYVQQQILDATGKTYLSAAYTSQTQQMDALLNNAASEAGTLGLQVGADLTQAQVAALTQPIVWDVTRVVNGQSVLVPELYLPAADNNQLVAGGTIGGNNVTLTASGLTNSGSITAAGKLTITTTGDITNDGGAITAGGNAQLSSTAGSIANYSTTQDFTGPNSRAVAQGSTGIISAGGNLTLTAASNIDATGSLFNAGGALTMLAGNDVSLGAEALSDSGSYTTKKTSGSYAQTLQVGTQVSAGGDLLIASGNDTTLTASSLLSGGDTDLLAGGALTLNTAQDSQSQSESSHSKGVFVSKSSSEATSSTTDIGTSLFAGGNAVLASGVTFTQGADGTTWLHLPDGQAASLGYALPQMIGAAPAGAKDITLTAANVVSIGDTALQATGNIALLSGQATQTSSASASKTQAGVFSSGASVTLGVKSASYSQTSTNTAPIGSAIESLGGSVLLTANGSVTLVGSSVQAAGDVSVTGANVTLDSAYGTATQTTKTSTTTSGLTLGLGGTVGNLINSVVSAAETASKGGAQGTLGGIQGAQAIYNNWNALQNIYSALSTNNLSSLAGGASINVQVTASTQHSQSSETLASTTAYGSSLSGGNNVVVNATNGNIALIGSTVTGTNVGLNATGDIDVLSAANTTSMKSNSLSYGGGIGVAVAVGNGFSVGFTANANVGIGNGSEQTLVWTPSTVTATNLLSVVSGGNTNVQGTLNGNTVILDVGGNLTVQSLQNTLNASAMQAGANGSVTVGYGVSGSASASYSQASEKYAQVGQQASINAGTGGLYGYVAGSTALNGGALLSTGGGSFQTGTLTFSNIDNTMSYSGTSVGGNAGYSQAPDAAGPNPDGSAGVAQPGNASLAPPGVATTGGGSSSTTFSAIGPNIVLTTGSDTAGLLRSAANLNQQVSTPPSIQTLMNNLQIQSAASSLAGQVANDAVGTYLAANKIPPDDPRAIALHGVVGVIEGLLGGGGSGLSALAGGASASLTEALTPTIVNYLAAKGYQAVDADGNKLYDKNTLLPVLNDEGNTLLSVAIGLAGAGTGGLIGGTGGALIGGTASVNAIQFNLQMHLDPATAEKIAVQVCGQIPGCVTAVEAAIEQGASKLILIPGVGVAAAIGGGAAYLTYQNPQFSMLPLGNDQYMVPVGGDAPGVIVTFPSSADNPASGTPTVIVPQTDRQVGNTADKTPIYQDAQGNFYVLDSAGNKVATDSSGVAFAAVKTLSDILAPGGQPVGQKVGGAGPGITTVTRDQFVQIETQLLNGATPTTTPASYPGTFYQRADGTVIGIRISDANGPTIEVINPGSSGLPKDFKVHQQ
jgi:filamentous hemagglutinin